MIVAEQQYVFQRERGLQQLADIEVSADPELFLQTILTGIDEAQEAIRCKTMCLGYAHSTEIIGRALLNKQLHPKTPVTASLIASSYSRMTVDDHFVILPFINRDESEYNQLVRVQQARLFKDLEDAGILRFANTRGRIGELIPIAGQDHRKWWIFDKKMAIITGRNHDRINDGRFDTFMIIRDGKIVKALIDLHDRDVAGEPPKDEIIDCGTHAKLINVSGHRMKPEHSPSMNAAIHIIDRANDTIQLTKPLISFGIVAQRLIDAHEKRRVEVIIHTTGRPKELDAVSERVHQMGIRQLRRQGITIVEHENVHAKGLIADHYEALYGSDNLDDVLIRLGTEELMIHLVNHPVVSQLEQVLGMGRSCIGEENQELY